MKKHCRLACFILAAATLWSANLSGDWTGSMALNSGPSPVAAHLKQDRNSIAGTEGPSTDKQFPITAGRIYGERVSIEARPGPSVLRLALTLKGNELNGDVFEDDRRIGTISLKRAN